MNFEDEKQRFIGLGFTGFTTISELVANIDVVPQLPGVYVVMRNNASQPEFLTRGTGGFFKDKIRTSALMNLNVIGLATRLSYI